MGGDFLFGDPDRERDFERRYDCLLLLRDFDEGERDLERDRDRERLLKNRTFDYFKMNLSTHINDYLSTGTS